MRIFLIFKIICLLLVFFIQIISFTCKNRKSIVSTINGRYSLSRRISFSSSVLLGSFDEEFANAISKPLPEWYVKDKQQREAYVKEVEDNRQRAIDEFRRKYESKTSTESVESLQEFGDKDVDETPNRNTISGKVTPDDLQENKDTGFYLPGFFDVFPELKLQWPKWVRRKNGGAIECETDRDCQFPQACCAHPILPMKKFCCTGYGQRIMEPAYVGQEIQVVVIF